MKLLALDASGSQASAALSAGGRLLVRSADAERGAGEQLLGFVDELLAEGGLALGQLDAIAFGRGPGAFTGLRLAASLTQGLAFAAGLQVLPVSNLEALARAAAGVGATPARVLACQDARMGECYWAGYDCIGAGLASGGLASGGLSSTWPEAVSLPGTLLAMSGAWRTGPGELRVTGSALAAFPQLADALAREGAVRVDPPGPPAAWLAALALGQGLAAAVPAEQAVPVYVRDDVARPAS